MVFGSECKKVRDLLWDFASGTSTGSEYDQTEAHLAHCESCRQELESYQNTIALMSEYKRDAVPASRLGWRDVERRVASSGSPRNSWAKRPLMQFVMGGGSLALATAFVMFVMQANMNPPGVHPQSNNGKPNTASSSNDLVSASETGDFRSAAGLLSMTQMPPFDESNTIAVRSAPPRDQLEVFKHHVSFASVRHTKSPTSPPAANDVNPVNVDGGSPVQALRPDYVLASASSGNDEDQNRRYVIDVVSSSRSSANSEGSEESHPW